MSKQIHLAAHFPGVNNTTVWSDPAAGSHIEFDSFRRFAQSAERGKFDFLFLAEGLRLREQNGQIYDLDVVGRPDTFTVLAALAAVTEHVGLTGTINSTFNEPYEVARQFASLDHLSGGRAAWNVVTSWDAFTGENFRRGGFLAQADRYERARTFLAAANELWDSWHGDEVIADAGAGQFLSTAKAGAFAHHDRFFDIEGQFNVPRSPQGRPVIFQAGDSDEGRDFAAASADAIFSHHSTLQAGQAFYADVKGRLARFGRGRDQLLILPAATFVLGDTDAEAAEIARQVRRAQVSPQTALRFIEQLGNRRYRHGWLRRKPRMTSTPLTVLDLIPISSGSTAAQALRNSMDLARQAEALGYARYWFAEHHLNPGVAGTSPAVVLALTAAATSTIRLGSGAVQMGHRTALSVLEEFGLLDAAYPGRFDLGLGRSIGGPREAKAPAPAADSAGTGGDASGGAGSGGAGSGGAGSRAAAAVVNGRTANGLLIPPRFSTAALLKSPRYALQKTLLQLPHAQPQNYTEQVGDVLALIAGRYRSADGEEAHVVPGEGAALQVWILGSSGGESAEVAGQLGLRFAANYHVSPATVLEAVEGYRAAFKDTGELDRPYVSVSADVVVAGTEARARELAAGYGPWVRSIRTAEGAIQFPTPAEARRIPWTDADRALVADRVDTQFTGTAAQVADQLERLRDATEADELIITTITHDHADRVRSYELLAQEWARR